MMVPYQGRRIACVPMSNDVLTAILQGELDRCLSSAPADMTVVEATTLDDHTIGVYVESATFEPLDDRGVVPVLDLVMTRLPERESSAL